MTDHIALAPSASASLTDWLTYLEQLHPTEIELGLERVTRVADRLAVRTPAVPVITVAGTNGKGSTVKLLESILQQAGYQTGVYISPHLYRYNERVRIAGIEPDDRVFCAAFSAIEQARHASDSCSDNTSPISLTYFEFSTLAALWIFQQQPVDVIILEVGLGGRLDAVNCVDADVAILTSIGLDHTDWLGDTRAAIGFEKAGIFRANRPAIIGDRDCPETVLAHAKQLGAKTLRIGTDFEFSTDLNDREQWHYQHRSGGQSYADLPMPQLPQINAAIAITALQQLSLPVATAAIRAGLASARVAGRLEFVAATDEHTDVLLDVGHNPHAAMFLRHELALRYPQRPIYAVVGMLKDKDIRNTVLTLAPLVERWFCATLSEPRGATAEAIAAALIAGDVAADTIHCCPSVHHAYTEAQQQAQQVKPNSPLVFVFGSFYTVGKIRF